MPTLAEIDAEIARRQQASSGPSLADIDAEIARRQQEQQSSPVQQQKPLSKWEAAKRGFGVVKDAVQGNAEFEDGTSYEDWLWSQPNFGVSKDHMLTTMAGMFGTDEDKAKSFIKRNPDKPIQFDKNKNPYFVDPESNKKVYLDMPGLDAGDVLDFIGEGTAYTVGGAATAPIQGVAKKAAAGALAQGSANAVNQKLAGREDVDLGEVAGASLGGALFEGGGQLINKIRNAKAGNLNITDDAQKALNFADEMGVPAYADDLTKSGTIKQVGQQLDQIPFIGGKKSREIQNAAQKDVAQEITNRFKMPDSEMDDLYGIVNKGAKNQLKRSQNIASKKYQKAYDELNQAGDFDLPEVKQFASQMIEKEMTKGSAANPELINTLKKFIDVSPGNFQHWGDIRSDITALVRDGSKGVNAQIGTKTTGALKQLSSVINNKLDEVATQAGGSAKWREANKFYDDAVVRYKRGVLKTAMNEDSPEKMLDLMIGRGGGFGTDSKDVGNKIYNSLDKSGKGAVRHGMMQKAYDTALDETGNFSPARYAANLEKMEKRLGVVLNKEDKKLVEGLNKYMRFTQDAGQYAANIPTGQKAVGTIYGMAAGAGLASNPVATAMGGLGVIGTKKLFRTPRGRSFLLALSSYPEGKTPPPELLKDLARFLAVKPSED